MFKVFAMTAFNCDDFSKLCKIVFGQKNKSINPTRQLFHSYTQIFTEYFVSYNAKQKKKRSETGG